MSRAVDKASTFAWSSCSPGREARSATTGKVRPMSTRSLSAAETSALRGTPSSKVNGAVHQSSSVWYAES
ncbi:Uncharacterised protein [Mycobacteroides abscessus subsp. abscessus]|nr:Uncharacterised protein [Mycobacteroides abscessus subsp. abscessus]